MFKFELDCKRVPPKKRMRTVSPVPDRTVSPVPGPAWMPDKLPLRRADSLENVAAMLDEPDRTPAALSGRMPLLRALQSACGALGTKKLRRSNRRGLGHLEDDSINERRDALTEVVLSRHQDLRDLPSGLQQARYADIVAAEYAGKEDVEAFCMEMSYLLLSELRKTPDISANVHVMEIMGCEDNDESHCFILYSEATSLDRLKLDYYTADLEQFAAHLFEGREKSLIVDPWGEQKMIGFEHVQSEAEIKAMLLALAERSDIDPAAPIIVEKDRPSVSFFQPDNAASDTSSDDDYDD